MQEVETWGGWEYPSATSPKPLGISHAASDKSTIDHVTSSTSSWPFHSLSVSAVTTSRKDHPCDIDIYLMGPSAIRRTRQNLIRPSSIHPHLNSPVVYMSVKLTYRASRWESLYRRSRQSEASRTHSRFLRHLSTLSTTLRLFPRTLNSTVDRKVKL
jgi:hypothetical protein